MKFFSVISKKMMTIYLFDSEEVGRAILMNEYISKSKNVYFYIQANYKLASTMKLIDR